MCYPTITAYSDAATLTVVQPNSPPVYTAGGNQVVDEDAGPVTVPGWATDIAANSLGVPEVPPTIVYGSEYNSLPEGAMLYGNASVRSGVLHVTDALNGAFGAFYTPNLPAPLRSYDITFKLLIGGGTCCGNPVDNPTGNTTADGMSVNIANDLPVPFAGTAEEGVGGGLTIAFDTWDNGGAVPREAPAFDLKWRGQILSGKLTQVAQSSDPA